MDQARFATLVRALEQRARQHPRLYRFQVAALASLGYWYVFGILVLVLGLIVTLLYLALTVGGGGIVAKLLIPLCGLAYVLLCSLWIKVPSLEGIPLTAERFPALAAAIERIRLQVDAPRFRRVLLDGAFNAAVTQRPRFALLGPSVSDLVIGLPLMQALSPQEFDAVLAHEMGHVSRQHGRFGHWIYRIRTTWSRLAAVVENGGGAWAGFLLGRFLSWYAPFFNAYSFVLARLDEYEADGTAVRLAGRSAFATALVRIAVLGRFHAERHWGGVSELLSSGGEMLDPHAAFAHRLADRLDPSDARRWLTEAMQQPTDTTDTHPSLSDRLSAVGVMVPPDSPTAPSETAANALLGSAADTLAAELDRHWRSQVEPQLQAMRAQRESAERQLVELEAGAPSTADPAWERVELLELLGRRIEARLAAEEVLQAQPEHGRALFFVGRELLAADEGEGLALLERVAVLLPAAAPAVQGLIFEYHWRHGRREEAEAARARLTQAQERLTAASKERASLVERPVLVPHGLPADQVEPIKSALAGIPGLREVYVARRVVVQMPEAPCYLVGIVPVVRWWQFRSKDGKRLLEAVMNATRWPEGTYFVVGEGRHVRLMRQMKEVSGARVTEDDRANVTPPLIAGLESARS